MIIKTLPLGEIGANCYIICDENTGEGCVIDPGEENRALLRGIVESGMKELKYILCTHGHFDHIGGVAFLKAQYADALVVIGKNDAPMLCDGNLNLAYGFGIEFVPTYADIALSGGEIFDLGELSFRAVHTPGHSEGGVCYVFDSEKTVFTGDTLFRGSIGRTDFPGGSYKILTDSLKKLKNLPEDFKVYSGHGESSTISRELRNNPYLR